MKAITLTQPWASLVAIGAKCNETRGWKTSHRGPLAIHAAKGWPKAAREFSRSGLVKNLLGDNYEFPRGVVVATCNLVDILPVEVFSQESLLEMPQLSAQECLLGDYGQNRYAWLLEDIEALKEPISARGALSIWELKYDK